MFKSRTEGSVVFKCTVRLLEELDVLECEFQVCNIQLERKKTDKLKLWGMLHRFRMKVLWIRTVIWLSIHCDIDFFFDVKSTKIAFGCSLFLSRVVLSPTITQSTRTTISFIYRLSLHITWHLMVIKHARHLNQHSYYTCLSVGCLTIMLVKKDSTVFAYG